MPKSKISQSSSVPTSSSATNRTPVKINSEGTPKSVSYTHLTLPTICSV